MPFTRRKFLTSTLATLGAAALPWTPVSALPEKRSGATGKQQAARWRRHNVSSPEGKRMLASYARGVQAMLKLPPTDPMNWFRISFIHLMDCPHGNWWFYVWHRGYVGYVEQAIRRYSGDPDFAMPFWDWTGQPRIPDGMFDGVLSPTDAAYEPYTGNLARFTASMQSPLKAYWDTLSAEQRVQLGVRGYPTFDALWNSVTGYDTAHDMGISGNVAFANTCGSRYLSRAQPDLDAKTAFAVSSDTVREGLQPKVFHATDAGQSFTSSKTVSHVSQPDCATHFCMLEGQPHNMVHNCIGGVGAVDPGPYGNMTNFLSPIDPIFFLHHANMDRLWDVWTRKQQGAGLPCEPEGEDRATYMNESFLFFVDGDGRPVGPATAETYFNTDAFHYDYGPGFGDNLKSLSRAAQTPTKRIRSQAVVSAGTATLTVANNVIKRHSAGQLGQSLVANLTLPRPVGLSTTREYDVLVNAPEDLSTVDVDSPYYAGTVAFFGPNMPGMHMSRDATFAVPLPAKLQAFSNQGQGSTTLHIRLVPAYGRATRTPVLRAATIVGG